MISRRNTTRGRAGFTLVEMLVVVAIIGILAAILVPAVYLGLSAATDARIAMELANLDAAMRQYKTITHGYAFPPNFGTTPAADAVVRAHIQQKFGRYDPTATGVTAPPTALDPAEALVFWLRGYGPNPLDPLAGERKGLFDFDRTRLVANEDINTDGKIDELDNDPTPVYYPRSGQKIPYIYFHHDFYALPISYNTAAAPKELGVAGVARPYSSDISPNGFVNPDTYQIISAGQDGDWGPDYDPTTQKKLFPSGLNYGDGDNDNITNFSEGTLGDKVE